MPHFYFDTRDGDLLVADLVGLAFDNIDAARDEATATLAAMARDLIPGSDSRELAVEVSDEAHEPLLTALLRLKVATVKREAAAFVGLGLTTAKSGG